MARYLFSSNFKRDTNAGAAGSLLAIAEGLEAQGHVVDFTWKPNCRYRLPHARLREIFELPERLRHQIAAQMEGAAYDYVIASQPYAYRAFEWLRQRSPGTVYVNRTHGWEERLIESNRRLAWRTERPANRLLSRASELATTRACARVAKAADGVIASSQLCADFICERYCLPEYQVAVIPHGVSAPDTGRVQERRYPGTRMLFAGQYLSRKGTAVLERELPAVLQAFPNATVTFVVPPESVALVKHRFSGLRITVLPWMPREELFAIYKRHDLFLYTSFFEGFGKVFLEAMASGMCVVGFAEGAIADIAKCGHDALFTTAGESTEFRELLLWALANPGSTQRIGRAAAETARQFTWDRTSRETHAFCERLRMTLPRATRNSALETAAEQAVVRF